MKKILQISKYYYPFIGGTEQVARDIAQALKGDDSIQQKIICFNEDAEAENYITHRNESVYNHVDEVEVIRCKTVVKISSQAISTSFGRLFDKIMRDFEPDVVILHYPNPFVTYYLLKYSKKNFKLIIYWHLDITKQKFLKKFFAGQNRALIKRADKIVGATPKHINESEYTEAFGEKKEILPYAIDEQRLKISLEEENFAKNIQKKYNGKIICFFIGRHVPYKGLAYLIEASRYVENNVKILIAGSGELTESLKAQAKNDSKIEFIGRISDSEWRSYLKACDIFCFPSITRNEGFGLALAEGMYYGKPAVTFTIPGSGVNYVNIDGLTGIECPNCDSMAYAEAINKLAKDEAMRTKMGINARERILQNFTFSQFQKNVIELINNLE